MSKTVKKRQQIRRTNFYKNKILRVVALVILFLFVILMVRGCGVRQGSPEAVVKSLIDSYAKGNQKNAIKCFGMKNSTEDLEKEIAASVKYFEAHGAKSVNIAYCDILSESKDYTYVYIIYKFKLDNGQEYPCISTYMVNKVQNKYCVIPTASVTAEMSKQAVQDYAKFMTTDIYKEYIRDYETFTKKNPGYEEKIAGKISL